MQTRSTAISAFAPGMFITLSYARAIKSTEENNAADQNYMKQRSIFGLSGAAHCRNASTRPFLTAALFSIMHTMRSILTNVRHLKETFPSPLRLLPLACAFFKPSIH